VNACVTCRSARTPYSRCSTPESESVTSAVGYGYNQDDIEESFRDRPVLYKPFEPAQLHAALVRAKK
jgi:hypothetical protein